jgi:hypothetical protein
MAAETIEVGDRVVNLQVPGVFTVLARRGTLLEIETAQGLRMTVQEGSVRRLDENAVAVPKDE